MKRSKGSTLLPHCPVCHHALHCPVHQGHQEGDLLPYKVHQLEDGRLVCDIEEKAEYPFALCFKSSEAVEVALQRNEVH